MRNINFILKWNSQCKKSFEFKKLFQIFYQIMSVPLDRTHQHFAHGLPKMVSTIYRRKNQRMKDSETLNETVRYCKIKLLLW